MIGTAAATPLAIEIAGGAAVSALLLRPEGARALVVFGHGAGAGMAHAFMESFAQGLAARAIATLRYQFPYMERGGGRPDAPALLERTVAAATQAGAAAAPGLPLFAGGKSMGGRISAQAAAKGMLPQIAGLLFVGFPLHPPKQPGTKRAACLADVKVPMLFLQGTRDTLAELELLRGVLAPLPRAELVVLEGADHSFQVLKRSGMTDERVRETMLGAIERFVGAHGRHGR